MIDRDDIRAAHTRIVDHVRRTPVLRCEAGVFCDTPVYLKLEQTQITGTFKVRGAFNNMLGAEIPAAGVVAASGGNHGAAVAYAATKLGITSKVFVPEKLAVEVKLKRMRDYGTEVVIAPGTVGEVMTAYADHARETGALALHPYDGAATLGGQGTVAKEIEEQIDGIDTVLVAVGGGGLIGGIAAWFTGRVNVIAVESKGTATFDKALTEGLGGDMEVSGVSASSLGAPDIGELSFEIAETGVTSNIVVSDADVYAAGRALWEQTRVVGEPGAATAMAALTSGAYKPAPGEKVCVVVCGANCEPDWFLAGDA